MVSKKFLLSAIKQLFEVIKAIINTFCHFCDLLDKDKYGCRFFEFASTWPTYPFTLPVFANVSIERLCIKPILKMPKCMENILGLFNVENICL